MEMCPVEAELPPLKSCLGNLTPRDDNFALCQTEASRTMVDGQRSAASECSKHQSKNHHECPYMRAAPMGKGSAERPLSLRRDGRWLIAVGSAYAAKRVGQDQGLARKGRLRMLHLYR